MTNLTSLKRTDLAKLLGNALLGTICMTGAIWAGFWAVRFIGEVFAMLSSVSPLDIATQFIGAARV